MANGNHKGTEFNNITETWDQNERKRNSGNATEGEDVASSGTTQNNDLQNLIRQEAAEYDNEKKENQLLSGDRATLNDVDADNSGE